MTTATAGDRVQAPAVVHLPELHPGLSIPGEGIFPFKAT